MHAAPRTVSPAARRGLVALALLSALAFAVDASLPAILALTWAAAAFHRSFEQAADYLTHGALALALAIASLLAWRARRSTA